MYGISFQIDLYFQVTYILSIDHIQFLAMGIFLK